MQREEIRHTEILIASKTGISKGCLPEQLYLPLSSEDWPPGCSASCLSAPQNEPSQCQRTYNLASACTKYNTCSTQLWTNVTRKESCTHSKGFTRLINLWELCYCKDLVCWSRKNDLGPPFVSLIANRCLPLCLIYHPSQHQVKSVDCVNAPAAASLPKLRLPPGTSQTGSRSPPIWCSSCNQCSHWCAWKSLWVKALSYSVGMDAM